ncbi:MAG TPA: AraC family transcriptional regulator [Pseudonocardiaceae bacterium]|nr:AraC family transcriptional regulator [Pseudonocardiaceae bacterium]
MTHPDLVPSSALRLRTQPTYWRCERTWSWCPRPLTDHLLWCVLDGIGTLELDGRRCDLEPGLSIVFAPGDTPAARHDPNRRLLVFGVHFLADGPVSPPQRWALVRDLGLLESLARHSDLAHRRGDPLGRHQTVLCLAQILCLIWETALHPPSDLVDAALADISSAIRQDPGRRWTIAELAARASLSRAQFTRRFAAHTGLPPGRYAVHARIARATELLVETTMSVTQVAAALGYTDVASFSRQYKWITGRTPSAA